MKFRFVFLIAGFLATAPATAQVGKEMKAFRDKKGVTVTLLTPSLYSLYQKENLGRLPGEILKSLEEVNVLRVDRQQAAPTLKDEIARRFNPVLENEARYTLASSRQLPGGMERVYTSRQQETISALVLWSENEREIVLVELKGVIQAEKARALSGVLQVRGLEQLAYALAPGEETLAGDPFDLDHFMQGFPRRPRSLVDSIPGLFGSGIEEIDALFEQMEETFRQMRNGESVQGGSYSRGLEVTRENGKTRIKVKGTNVEVLYLIDGKVFAADSLTSIPEEIATVEMHDAPDDPRKAYVVINTLDKIGQFTGFSGGVLRFRHENQDYAFNLERLPAPALLVNNRPAREPVGDPARILQIRPATGLERLLFSIPSLEVIIVMQ